MALVLQAAVERAARASSPGPPVRVTYLGPGGRLSGLVRLRAAATSGAARIVAVTYLLDGKPLGSDTSPPYSLDVNAGLLPPGRHDLRITAIDSLGRSAKSSGVRVRTVRRPGPLVTASPSHGLERALTALRAGGATVVLRPGRYVLDEVAIGSGARLVGSSPGTVIAAPPGTSYSALLTVRGSGIRVSDLTLDGGGPGSGEGIAVAISDGSSDVRLQRLRVMHVRGDGIVIRGAHSDVSVQDSGIDGDGSGHAGVLAWESDQSRDVSVIRTKISGFRSYGIDFAQKEFGRPAAGLHALALDNEIVGIRDPAREVCRSAPLTAGCGTNEAGIESGAVQAAFIGNTIRRTAWDGIETVGSSTRTSVVGNEISGTQTGIYLEHSTNNSLIAQNVISRVRTGINVEWLYGGVGSKQNAFVSNRISRAWKTGIFLDVGADANVLIGNHFIYGGRPAIVLQGSSLNVVRGNRGCGAAGPFVRQQSGSFDDGSAAKSTRNLTANNITRVSCRTP